MLNSRKRWLYNWFVSFLPGGKALAIKRFFLRRCGVFVANDCCIEGNAKFYGNGKIILEEGVILRGDIRLEVIDSNGAIHLKDHSEVNHGSYLAANGGSTLTVGRYTRIAHFCSLKTTYHSIDIHGPCIAGDVKHGDIAIGDGCWLCAGVVIIPSVTIGNRVVVAAGATVINNIPDCSLVAGTPGIIKKRYS